MANKEVDKLEYQKRVHQISLLMNSKPTPFIIEFIIQKWGIKKAQAYNYIKAARKEWQKHFLNVKKNGMGYHLNKRKEIRSKAIDAGDYRLALDADKDEAKLMGIYPAEKMEVTKKVIQLGKKKKEKGKEEDKNEEKE